VSDEPKPLRQCSDCGGVTTHGGPFTDATRPGRSRTAWMCLWCIDGWEGWPRAGSWRIATDDDRVYPEGNWEGKRDPAVEALREACISRGCVPPPPS
jgi:hypothetical protein